MAKQKKDLSLIVWAFGWLLGIAVALKKFAAVLSVPFEAFERLGSDQGEVTIGRIVQLIHSDWLVAQSDIYRIRVNRGPLPTFTEIETEYGKGNVSNLYDGREWTKHPKRVEHDVTAEKVDVLVKDFAEEIASGEIKLDKEGCLKGEDLIAWGLRNDWVPADEKEAYEVGRDPKTCDLQLKNWLVALGSSVRSGDGHYVVVLSADVRVRVLDTYRFDRRWNVGCRFLFVRFVRKSA